MNLSYFISKRITSADEGGFSKTIHKIAITSIAIGLAIMLVSFLILSGFQNTVTNKIYSFSSHIQITKYTLGSSFEEEPVSLHNDFFKNHKNYGFIDHVQEFGHKPGLIKTVDKEVLGVVFKGMGNSFDTLRFGDHLKEGRFMKFDTASYSKEIIISQIIADKLQVNLGDQIIIHFFMNPPRHRKLEIVGIYETNLSEYYDSRFIIGDIGLIQRLNQWDNMTAGGLEVFVKDSGKVNEAEEILDGSVDYDLFVEKVSDKFLQVFDWLHLISRQVNIFLSIILLVVCVNMISIILILIMERTQMIGLLGALGATLKQVRGIFLLNGIQLILKGLMLGNLIGLGVCALQYFFKLIPLNPQDYYMSYVPVGWNWEVVIYLNLLTLIVVSLIVLIPTIIISRISPIKSIKFD